MSNTDRPASFMLNNSKGHPDFVMTMLVAVILATFLVILFWMWMNTQALEMAVHTELETQILSQLKDFNETSRYIILGLFSSVFSLAGAYYLRRSSYDKHFQERERTRLELGADVTDGGDQSGFQPIDRSTRLHPSYDDGEEDI